jgi:plastocyanin
MIRRYQRITGTIITTILLLFLISALSETQEQVYATVDTSGVTQQDLKQQLQPNLSASSIYETQTMVLGNDIKNLVILLPNEAHESQTFGRPTSEDRLINQPYVPQKVTVSPGTMVTWFNGDVDHDHKITLINDASPENVLFDSGVFAFNEPSEPVVLNDTGAFNYYETNVNEEDENFVMNGTITVVAQQGLNDAAANGSVNSASILGNADTAGVLMVPTQDIETYVQDLTSKGFVTESTHNFNDIRSGDQQTLMVWTSSGMDLDQVIPALQEITPGLPYS